MALRVAVIGGGIGGLTAALALLQAGFEVEVYEQAPELTEVGGGINMAPNASRVLRRLGLAEGLDREGVRPLGTQPAALAGWAHLAARAAQSVMRGALRARRI